jgi:hypothetical protein
MIFSLVLDYFWIKIKKINLAIFGSARGFFKKRFQNIFSNIFGNKHFIIDNSQ